MYDRDMEEFINDFNFNSWIDDYSRKLDEEIIEAQEEAE